MIWSRSARTSLSDPDASGLKTLVESPITASTPSAPMAVNSAAVEGDPSTGSSSSFQSPVWNPLPKRVRSEEHTSELHSLMRLSYAVFCLSKHKKQHQ